MHIAFVLGTRPEIIKLSSLIKACQDQRIDYTLIHTNQHYSSNMDARFFEELALPPANFNLGVGACPPASQVGRMLVALEPLLNELQPDHVVVQGDTNSALAGGLAGWPRARRASMWRTSRQGCAVSIAACLRKTTGCCSTIWPAIGSALPSGRFNSWLEKVSPALVCR